MYDLIDPSAISCAKRANRSSLAGRVIPRKDYQILNENDIISKRLRVFTGARYRLITIVARGGAEVILRGFILEMVTAG